MIQFISEFIASKSLTANSQKSYLYDLQQFMEITGETINQEKLTFYEQSLLKLKVSAKKRKISAVNQFLFFLYEKGELTHFYKIKNKEKLQIPAVTHENLDTALFYQATTDSTGQLIALLIVELGLSPSELIQLQWEDFTLDFQVLTVKNEKTIRVLELPDKLMPYLRQYQARGYLFNNKGKSYSRQWLFRKLSRYLDSLGLTEMTAQKLREQFIIKEKNKGVTIFDLAKHLGLKSPVTLEKYYRD
ncbi:site-specific tyrosine recombinase XerD [Streptococcus macacae]|uniref:Tyrosine recombinase XerD-like n=1 Tax=Streptococcus macacae NCTC 11558 TaxID=764298 RepID=G5JY76_9STRE|nr:site-specific tyrosine recombinase XerD [Streptococcus macacae]EHJ51816.1 site-specific tyrosine recombinase XerD-like protein [Streptococcus macacae NCTC 11558]SUN77991.1 site-specific tyrosine recombinase XerD [Streptococcus macacae NCTC 11558]